MVNLVKKWWETLKNGENTNRVIAVATVVIAISAVVQGGAAILQYLEMRSGGEQTDKLISAANQIKSALVTANKQNSDAVAQTMAQNQRQFEATLGQMKKQIADFENSQAAHLSMEDWPIGRVKKGVDVTFILANRGNSIATEIEQDTTAGNSENFSEVWRTIDNLPIEPSSSGFSLAQGQTRTIETNIGADYLAQNTYFWYGVKFAYLDIFGHKQTIVDCLYLLPKRFSLLHCPQAEKNTKNGAKKPN
jgi:hypothetical protein